MTNHEQQLRDFAKMILRLSWEGGVDGSDIEDAAVKHGLIVSVIYDPVAHGDVEDAVPGEDTIYIFSDWMKEGEE